MGRPKGKSSPEFAKITEYLSTKKFPEECIGNSGQKANFKRLVSNYSLIDGVLYRKHKPHRTIDSVIDLKVILSEDERRNIIRACHDGSGQSIEAAALGGHCGQEKTTAKIMERFWWPGVSADIKEYIRTCDVCQRANSRFTKAAPELHPVPVQSTPWKQIGVDLCSLPTSSDGYTCMAVAVDYFTKWVEAEPLRSKTAEAVAGFLYNLICRHGCAEIQINDQGREFVNKVSDELHGLTGVKQRITSAYHPQSNGLTERNNRSIQCSLLKVLQEHQLEWPKALPGVLFAFRTSRQKSTGYSPFFLMYGRQARLPLEIEDKGDDTCEEEVKDATPILDEFLDHEFQERLAAIENVRMKVKDVVEGNIKHAQDRQKRDYEKRHAHKRHFVDGDEVLLWNSRRADRKGGKSQNPWLGPYIISRTFPNGTYELVNDGKIMKKKANAVNLKPYLKRETDITANQQSEPITEETSTETSIGVHEDNTQATQAQGDQDENCDVYVVAEDTSLFQFKPTNAEWRKEKCAALSLPKPQKMRRRQLQDSLSTPKKLNQ